MALALARDSSPPSADVGMTEERFNLLGLLFAHQCRIGLLIRKTRRLRRSNSHGCVPKVPNVFSHAGFIPIWTTRKLGWQ